MNTFSGRIAPATLASYPFGKLADLAGELAAAGLIHQFGQLCSQAGALPRNPRAHKKPEHTQTDEKQKVDNRDPPDAAVDQLLQPPHCGINEVGKKNGEQEENQRSPRRIEKAQPHREEQGRKQHARRA